MPSWPRHAILALLALSASGLAAGCTRSSDGTVVMARPSMAGMMPRWLRREREAAPAPAVILPPPVEAAEIEVSPAPAARPAPRRHARRTVVRPAPAPTPGTKRELACEEQTSAGGRVRVVCR